jgi:hypothetical protein
MNNRKGTEMNITKAEVERATGKKDTTLRDAKEYAAQLIVAAKEEEEEEQASLFSEQLDGEDIRWT